jgi:hypothetical protein
VLQASTATALRVSGEERRRRRCGEPGARDSPFIGMRGVGEGAR